MLSLWASKWSRFPGQVPLVALTYLVLLPFALEASPTALSQQQQQDSVADDDQGEMWFRKRAEDDNYIRFGKRDGELASPMEQHRGAIPILEPLKKAAEGTYIRFGKKRSLLNPTPCTIQFLRHLPSNEARLRHVKACSISRHTRDARSDEEGYIRFGKRSYQPIPYESDSTESFPAHKANTMQIYIDPDNDKCVVALNPDSPDVVMRDCSALLSDDNLLQPRLVVYLTGSPSDDDDDFEAQ